MSVDYHVHIGPIIRIKSNIEVEEKSITCPTEGCRRHGTPLSDSNYCNVCGSKIKEIFYKVNQRISVWDLEEAAGLEEDTFSHLPNVNDNELILVSNTDILGRDEQVNIVRDFADMAFAPADIEKELNLFKKAYKSEIAKLSKYLKEEIKIEWAVIGYCS